MADGFLKFTDKAEAQAFFMGKGVDLTPSGAIPDVIFIDGRRMDIHIVNGDGIVYQLTGNMLVDEDGIEYPERVAVSGYHINVRYDAYALPEDFMVHAIVPVNPVCVWA